MSDQTEALQAQVLQACEGGPGLQARGSGSYALPLRPGANVINTTAHCGVVSYDPTEMVITVRSGTTLAEVESVLAEQGQRLGVECPRLSAQATIGGAIAMGLSGSSRPFTGALRDYVLGVRMINGLGDVLNFGGQVMKNVAGYDVSRLLVGSRGQLGLLLELSLRVLPLPEEELYLVFEMDDLPTAAAFGNRLLTSAEPLSGASFHAGRLHLRFSGRQPSLARLRQDLGGETGSVRWWDDLQRWKLPWGRPRWRSYRSRGDSQPQSEGEWLADWNGGLVFSDRPEPSAEAAVDLEGYSATETGLEDIQARLRVAFDPDVTFSRVGDS